MFLRVSASPLDMFLFFLFFWFSRRFLQNQQILRENQTIKENQRKQNKTLGTTNNNKVVKGFSLTLGYVFFLLFFYVFFSVFSFSFLVFPNICLVFFSMFGFLEICFGFVKNFRGNQQNKKQKTNPYPRVRLKPLKTLFFVPNVCLVFFGFL